MSFARRTDHTAKSLRWILTGPTGDIELRVTVRWAALLHHGEAEICPGEEIALLWRAADHDDELIWRSLEDAYPRLAVPADATGTTASTLVSSHSAALQKAAAWVEFATEHGTAADVQQAVEQHLAVVHELIRTQRSR
ncbi:hypothetical protein GCM10009733_020670 [Nonomuraea maheshkhaliensis]|uniref:GntR family transcriptional regulator n=1 Tax=Nonomuraea maheshkhaliensis TaxID=419590 RepID=A0ABN2EZX0_9ACTN